MAYFAGLDVSLKETSVCIVDDAAGRPHCGAASIRRLQRAQTSNTRLFGRLNVKWLTHVFHLSDNTPADADEQGRVRSF
jgi:hypothetical protein